jgi:hypothetical protein
VANEKKPIIIPKDPYLPFTRDQNPAPVPLTGQQGARSLQDITNSIMRTFQQVLASNYVSQIPGPFYWVQYQALAEELAKVQLALEDVGLESDVDFARPEYLWQMIGTLVFPDTSRTPKGNPEIDGDLTYREFLKRMIQVLLQGATEAAIDEGLEILTEAEVEVLSKVDFSHREISAWGFGEQNEMESNVLCQTVWTDPDTGEWIEGDLGTGFPIDVFRVFRNNLRILRALKPAKALFEYRHLFKDAFGTLFEATPFVELEPWYYEDFRKFCCGMKEIEGTGGVTLGGLQLFSDPSLDFGSVSVGAVLEIFDGPNASPANGGQSQYLLGKYQVVGVLRLVFGFDADDNGDPVPRPYVTSPTGLTGEISTLDDNGNLEDPNQDFSNAEEGEILTIQEGPNAGNYRLSVLLGNNGGPLSEVPAGSLVTGVRVAPTILQTRNRMIEEASGQSYRVSLERLGVRSPLTVLGEDASAQFYL